jgi:hypothetical protein
VRGRLPKAGDRAGSLWQFGSFFLFQAVEPSSEEVHAGAEAEELTQFAAASGLMALPSLTLAVAVQRYIRQEVGRAKG